MSTHFIADVPCDHSVFDIVPRLGNTYAPRILITWTSSDDTKRRYPAPVSCIDITMIIVHR